jgi:hypothetical protein
MLSPMKGEARFTLLDPRNRGMMAALLRSKRQNAIPTDNAQIREWESEGGLTTPPATQ